MNTEPKETTVGASDLSALLYAMKAQNPFIAAQSKTGEYVVECRFGTLEQMQHFHTGLVKALRAVKVEPVPTDWDKLKDWLRSRQNGV